MAAPRSVDDPERLAAVARSGLLDTPAEERFDTITRQVIEMLGAPIAVLSIVDRDRQFFKSSVGLAEPWASKRESPLSHSFCQHVVTRGMPLVIDDATSHPLGRESPAIEESGIVSYLGVPVEVEGVIVGSLCAVDSCRRDWKSSDIDALMKLAATVSTTVKS